jgi:hypothetical protein
MTLNELIAISDIYEITLKFSQDRDQVGITAKDSDGNYYSEKVFTAKFIGSVPAEIIMDMVMSGIE